MTDVVRLVEYESTEIQLTEQHARRLRSAAAGVVRVEPGSGQGLWQLTATEYVGTFTVDDLRVLIRPKIRPENLFLLLEVGLSQDAWRREAFDYEINHDLLPAVIAFFARTLETTLARGLLRSYREQQERLVALRGRIDMAGQFRNAGIQIPVACRYDEFTADNRENRYLRSAVRRSLQVAGVLPEDRQRLLRQLAAMDEVEDAVVQASDLDAIAFTRLNQHYQPALRLARLLLENLTLVDQSGATGASSFLVDMNLLFERFVTERLRRELRGRLDVGSQFPTHLAERRQVSIRPDLVFRRRGVECYVADIKYKLTKDARARTSDYYQLLAYTTALDLPEGVLIYCLSDGGQPERSVTVRHAGKVLHTLAVNLSGPPESVAEELAAAANWIERRSRASVLTVPARR